MQRELIEDQKLQNWNADQPELAPLQLRPNLPRDLLQKAVPLLEAEASRNDGLRLTAEAALMQNATRMALDATAELLRRPGRKAEDQNLRAQALILASHFGAALETTRRAAQSSDLKASAAIAHMLSGNPAEALASANDAFAMGGLAEREARRLPWLAAYASALLREPHDLGPGARWSGTVPPDPFVPILGLFDYKSPDIDRNSLNIGDWMQTLAAMRHVARLENVTWTFDDPGFEALLIELRGTWKAVERIDCKGRKAHLAVIDRDFPLSTTLRFAGRRVWVIGNGWYSTPVFGDTRAWPAPSNLEPVLLSVHVSKPSDLTHARMNWLKAHGPVGCRDRATERWLANQGVETFFSGCLTMTLQSKACPSDKSGERLLVDAAAVDGQTWTQVTHEDTSLRSVSCSAGVSRALSLLKRYAASSAIRTSRLHCALPARAVGAVCDFVPKVASDRRFDGLMDLDERTFSARRNDLCDQMANILPLILEGRAPDVVRAPLKAFVTIPKKSFKWPRVGEVKSSHRCDEVTVALSFDTNFAPHARTLLASIRRTCKAALRIVMLVRGVSHADTIASDCDPFDVRVFSMEDRLAGVDVGLEQQTTISTMDRLFLPELLKDLDRIVYLDCDTLVRSDLCELASLDTGPTGVAAKSLHGPIPVNLAHLIERRAQTLSSEKARGLRVWGAENVNLAAPCYNAGVMVLALDTLRRTRLAERALSLVAEFGLHDQEALNLVTAGQHSPIPSDWNVIAHTDHCVDPKLIHWAGRNKPWAAKPVKFGTEWKALRDTLVH